jgi:hypothetical protein
MKNSKSLIGALVLATVSFGSSAVMAADISQAPQPVSLTDNSGFFGDAFAMDNSSNTFADRFTFSVTGPDVNLDAIVASISRTTNTGLNISGLSLYDTSNTLIRSGTALRSGTIDVWTVSSNNLTAGNYYLQVNGGMAGTSSGAFGGSVMLAPVPEPGTYGMLLGGLGALGFLARGRKSRQV